MTALPVVAVAAVVEDVAGAEVVAAAAVEVALELELLELPQAASTSPQVASAAIPVTRNRAVLSLIMVAPTFEVSLCPPIWRVICEDPNRGPILPARDEI
ncbi:MAG TPA: hypothetical protein VMF57_08085 [Solirubrobacteraceae bacterium]|nr:hypothetical protein [Solirubrobacteraceae bacterium]